MSEVSCDIEVVGEGVPGAEVNFDPDIDLLTTVAKLLSSVSLVQCSKEGITNLGERLIKLGEKLKEFEKLYLSKEEENLELKDQLDGWGIARQMLEERLEQGQRENREEIKRIRRAHAEEVARIKRKFETELEGLRRGAREEPQAPVVLEGEPEPDQAPAIAPTSVEVPQSPAMAQDASPAETVERMEVEADPDPGEAGVATGTPAPAGITEPSAAPRVAYNFRQRNLSKPTEEGGRGGEEEEELEEDLEGEEGEEDDTSDEDFIPTPPPETPAISVRRSLQWNQSSPNQTSRAMKKSSESSRLTRSRANLKVTTTTTQDQGPEEVTRPFQCDHCGVRFLHQKNHRRHVKALHSESVKGPYRCTVWYCLKQYSSKSYFEDHLKTHGNVDLYKCKTCGKILANKKTFKSHLEGHDPNRERRFKCPTCDKAYFSLAQLGDHKRTHRSTRPYKCPQCPKRFQFNHQLTKHLRLHSEHRPYSCDQCDRRFKRPDALLAHILVHTGERSFACQMCGKAFGRRSNLTRHVQQVHGGEKRRLLASRRDGEKNGMGRSLRVKRSGTK